MAEATSQQDLCGRCGKAKRQLKRMSLTQWMFSPEACNCDVGPQFNPHQTREFTSVMELCSSCGLPVFTGRIGSMTHWIFKSNSCSCALKQLQESGQKLLDQNKVSSEVALVRQILFESGSQPAKSENFLDGTEVASPLTEELGLPSDRYHVMRLVGQGAISKVYECKDKVLQREVAIKFLIGTTWTSEQIVRFQAEAKATSKLTHPNIVTVLDFGATAKGQPYMVLEYFTGVSLGDLIVARGPLPQEVAIEIAIQICSGMEYAHQKGIYHRDLKPANTMLIDSGTGGIDAKVIDFGIAEFQPDQSFTITGAKEVVGTPNYMSPDQVQGRKFDARSDVYSVGCSLFEALTGRPPFMAETALEIVTMHVNKKPPGLKETFPSGAFSESMEALIRKALEKSPDNRFQSMAELQEALEKCYHEQVEVAQPIEDHSTNGADDKSLIPALRVKEFALIALIAVFMILAGVSVSKLFTAVKTLPGENEKVELPKSDELRYKTVFSEIDIMDNLQGDSELDKFSKDTTEIHFSGANITDKGVDKIVGMPLVTLRLVDTKITDASLPKLASIKTLENIILNNNAQLSAFDALAALPKLRSLGLLNCELTDDDLIKFKDMKTLRILNISDNPDIKGPGLVYLRDLPNLRDLSLVSTRVTTDGIRTVLQIKKLERLNLSFLRLTDSDLKLISKKKGLTVLGLNRCKNITDKGVSYLMDLPNLEKLTITYCPQISTQMLWKLKRRGVDVNATGTFEQMQY